MDYVFVFNSFESVLWLVISITLLRQAFRQPNLKGRLLLSAFGLFAFAGTDVVEMQTGAWWRPWWLFAWKAACMMLLVGVGIYHYRSSKTPAEDQDSGPQ